MRPSYLGRYDNYTAAKVFAFVLVYGTITYFEWTVNY